VIILLAFSDICSRKSEKDPWDKMKSIKFIKYDISTYEMGKEIAQVWDPPAPKSSDARTRKDALNEGLLISQKLQVV